MAEECEVKFLTIEKEEIIRKLSALGAKHVGSYHYRRILFDYPDYRLLKRNAWIRLRDEGDQVMLTYKHHRKGVAKKKGDKDEGLEEIQTTVGSFDDARAWLKAIGLIEKYSQENKRTRYELDGTLFEIDEYPRLKPYLEIEAPNWEGVERGIELLGLNPDDRKICTAYDVYKLNGIDENDYSYLGFDHFITKDGKKV